MKTPEMSSHQPLEDFSLNTPVSRRTALAKTGLTILGGIGLISGLSACGDNGYSTKSKAADVYKSEQLKVMDKLGLFGNHDLVDLRDVTGFELSGGIDGGFFTYSGSIHGQTTTFFEFAWKPNLPHQDEIIVSTIPEERVFFHPDDGKDVVPTIKFGFDLAKIEGAYYNGTWWSGNVKRSDLPNDFIKNGLVHKVDVTMTNQQFREFAGNQNLEPRK